MRYRRLLGATLVVLISATTAAVPAVVSQAATVSAGKTFSHTEKVSRINLVSGKNQVVDRRTITLKVSDTSSLRGRQEIGVTWTGAHPTGGIAANQNSIDAQAEEYPMVLLECRGVDSAAVKASLRLSQKTCWTQSWSERYQDSYDTDFPPYRVDRYASKADRGQTAGAPAKLSTACELAVAPTQHWVPFIAANGHVYDEGSGGCAGVPPESQSVTGAALPSNETFGVTGLDGRGSANFDVWTSAENASLGCTQLVACSLVAVPIMGISCDVAAKGLPSGDRPRGSDATQAAAGCETKGDYQPGQLASASEKTDDLSVTGSLWWSASNWRNRISVPLSFAVPANACDVVSNSNSVQVYGSELLIQATGQWAPHFCLNAKLFNFTHVQTGEPEARNLLAAGGAEGAFDSGPEPGGYDKPVVNAPVAVGGFDIGYTIDGTNRQPIKNLRLTPLLLAKLLTESYPAILPIQQGDTALSKNPLNITDDPQFQQLNPAVPKNIDASQAAAALLTLSSDSDVITALTTYINDDPTARAWLNGKPDPYGMVVNPAYKGIKLPVDQWPLLSTYEPTAYYATSNDCLHNTPVPYLPLVAAPEQRLESISEDLQFSLSASTTQCSQVDGTSVGEKLVALGRQTTGFRFMIGVTSVADAKRYQLSSAALQTTKPSSFVAPTVASMKAAASFLKPDKKTGTWPVPYETLRTAAKATQAYPGIMVVYASVPTTGLPAKDAADLAQFIRYVSTTGQTPGLGVGHLPPGYLPITKADGLAQLENYSVAAATDVANQKGKLPALTGNPPPADVPLPGATSTSTSSSTPTTNASSSTTVPPVATPPSAKSPSVATTPTPTASSQAPTTTVALGRTVGGGLGGGAFAVVVIIVVALAGGLGAPVTFFVGRRRGRW